MKIMFICTGNICRSAMAHVLLDKRAKEEGKDIDVFSCGVYAEDGDTPPYNAIRIMDYYYETDITKHKAVNIKKSKIKEMDVILCATISHKNQVMLMYPELTDKVFTMKEYSKTGKYETDLDIKDPWGYDIETFRNCAEEISEVVEKIIKEN